MLNENHMLVLIDPDTDEQPALLQAEELAQAYGAKLTALLCVYDRAAEIDTVLGGTLLKNMRKPLLEKKREWLEGLLVPLKERGVNVVAKVEWAKRDYELVDDLVERESIGLVIKSSHHHPVLQRILFKPSDWHLVRSNKASILFVQQKQTLIGGQLLMAMDVVDDEESLDEMNRMLMEEGKNVAAKLSMEINLANAYPSVYVFATFAPQEFSPPVIQKGIKEAHEEALKKLAESYNVDSDKVFLQEGLVGPVVADVARDINAGLVIVGSHARKGASAFFVGNTAESVLETVDRNLLVIKSISD